MMLNKLALAGVFLPERARARATYSLVAALFSLAAHRRIPQDSRAIRGRIKVEAESLPKMVIFDYPLEDISDGNRWN